MSSVQPGWYRFRDALEQGDFAAASALLLQDPRLIDHANNLGETVLHFLAVENNQPAVEWLASRGADLNPSNEFGTPLLFEVAQLGYRELLLWLVRHGAAWCGPEKEKHGRSGYREVSGGYGPFGNDRFHQGTNHVVTDNYE
jgi:hypothetical protein